MFKYLDKRQYGTYNHQILSNMSKDNENFIQRMSLLKSLDIHHGCVNSVIWDDRGELLLSGSDDQHLIISSPWGQASSNKLNTAHRANIFSAKFIPYSANRQIISCSGDGMVIYTDLDRIPETYNCKFTCHIGTCYDVITVTSDPNSFFTCGEDGSVRWYDLRIKTSCLKQDCHEDVLLNMQRAVTAIAINPMANFQLAVSTQDSITHIFDRRMLGIKANDSYVADSCRAVLMRLKPESLEKKSQRVTSLRYSSKGDKVLASYSSDYLYLFDIQSYQTMHMETTLHNNYRHSDISSPSLKRLRLRGDWSDTGPQALPESEFSNQIGDVGQARPTLHSTLMHRMADILSRMLPNPSNQISTRSGQNISLSNIIVSTDHSRNINEISTNSIEDVSADLASASEAPVTPEIFELAQQTPSAPSSIDFPTTKTADLVCDNPLSFVMTPSFTSETPPSHLESYSLSPSRSTNCDNESENVIPKSDFVTTQDILKEIPEQNILDLSSIVHSDTKMDSNLQSSINTSNAVKDCCLSDETATSKRVSNLTCSNIVNQDSSFNSEPTNTCISQTEDCLTSACEVINNPEQSTFVNKFSNEQPSISSQKVSVSDGSIPSQDENSEETTFRSKHSNSRLAWAIERVRQRIRDKNKPIRQIEENMRNTDGNIYDNPIPYGLELMQYKGHRNARTMIKEACFWGENHVMSGSDCGRVFVWEIDTGRLVMLWEADRHVVNCLQPHPSLPILATSGIDYDVKLWAPLFDGSQFDEESAFEIAKRNETLLSETKDTVTVPATFMIRMLASLNQLRRDRLRRSNQNQSDDDIEE